MTYILNNYNCITMGHLDLILVIKLNCILKNPILLKYAKISLTLNLYKTSVTPSPVGELQTRPLIILAMMLFVFYIYFVISIKSYYKILLILNNYEFAYLHC